MSELLIDGPETLALLYGESFYIFPQDANAALTHVVATPKTEPIIKPIAEKTKAPVPQTPTVVIAPEPPVSQPQNPVSPPVVAEDRKPGITWKTKPTSKVLFVLQISEFRNPDLLNLLKKIVDSLKLAVELVGFGQIDGTVHLEEFDRMPNPYAVIFDSEVWGGAENPVQLGKGEVYFSHRLEVLQNDQDLKRELWAYLKQLKEKLQ